MRQRNEKRKRRTGKRTNKGRAAASHCRRDTEEGMKKKLKRILAVTVLIIVALVISYLIYTGGQTGA